MNNSLFKRTRVSSYKGRLSFLQWKYAVRAKRRAAAKYHKNKTELHWELKWKCRNEATRQRRIAIKQYWKKKSDDLKANPRDFFGTFKPFLVSKKSTS